ncbi:MAG: hypothetical protein ABJ388_13895 [Alphaproteobacteria bacterium]
MRKHRSPAFTAIAALTVTAGLGACETPQQVTDLTTATRDNFVALKKQIGKFETTAKSLDRRYAESLARQEKNLDDTFESMRDTQDVFLMRTGASVKASNALVGKWLTYDAGRFMNREADVAARTEAILAERKTVSISKDKAEAIEENLKKLLDETDLISRMEYLAGAIKAALKDQEEKEAAQ